MRIAICDDEKRIRDILSEAVRDVTPDADIECFADAGPVLAKSYDADILFLDIQMPRIDGMKAARIIRSIGKETVIVFVTALEEQVFNAFDVGAFQYIVKPFEKGRIKEVIRKAIAQAEKQRLIDKTIAEKESDTSRFITVKSGGVNTKAIIAERVLMIDHIIENFTKISNAYVQSMIGLYLGLAAVLFGYWLKPFAKKRRAAGTF